MMEWGREEGCSTEASSCPTDGDDSSITGWDLNNRQGLKCGSQRCASSFSSSSLSLQRRVSFLSCIIVFLALGGGGIGNQGVGLAAGAGISLKVSRKFSKMEGSGMAEGETGGMTIDHYRQLRDHDYRRGLLHHGRFLSSTTVADFPLAGNDYDIGLYYTEIGLGTPSGQYYVQVDTGSDLLWVNCQPCVDCPTNSNLPIKLRLYNPTSSTTASNSSCSSSACDESAFIGGGTCIDNSCYYSFQYGDGSTAMGYLVQDVMTFDTGFVSNNTMSQASADLILGCGFNQTGISLTSSSEATDGIMGFGRSSLSVISQLSNAGITTNMFAHCLQGDTGEGGTFVIGDVNEPGIVYTGLVADLSHYNVVLQGMSLGGTPLDIPSSAFDATGADTGTIFDSGTTLALLVDEAYNVFEPQLISMVPPSRYIAKSPCFQVQNNNLSIFPNLTLNFKGASMELGPTNYLFLQSVGSYSLWCLGWTKSSDSGLNGLTILGDIVLKNKLVIYDLQNSRIGWVNYNCLSSISVSNGTAGAEVINPGGLNSAPQARLSYHSIAVVIFSVVLIFATIPVA
ncbi:unnamed protein product [Calypogeia fissa]